MRAFEGAHAVYCVTNFWEHRSPERELAQAGAMAQAAACVGNEHVIWSTLEDTRRWIPLDSDQMPTLLGHYKVPHFDAKGEANEQFTRRNVPATFLLTSFYWDNFINFPGMGPRRDRSGVLTLTMPMGDKRLPSIAAEDIGRCAVRDFSGRPCLYRADGGHRRRAPHGCRNRFVAFAIARRAGAICGDRTGRIPAAGLPRRGRPGQHVSVQTGFSGRVLRGSQRRTVTAAEPIAPDVRAMARRQQPSNPDRLTRRGRVQQIPAALFSNDFSSGPADVYRQCTRVHQQSAGGSRPMSSR